MSDIPAQKRMDDEEAFERLQVWFLAKAELNEAKQKEHMERVALAGHYFSAPDEGTNRMPLGGGFDLKLTHAINRKIDEGELDNVTADDVKRLNLPMEELVEYKPTLNVRVYRTLNAEQKLFVDQFVESKDGSPQMEIVPAANTEGQQAHIAAAEAKSASELLDPRWPIALVAEKAVHGDYYYDGDTWWWLNANIEWDEVPPEATEENGDTVTNLLDQQLHIRKQMEASKKPAKPAAKKRGRPSKKKEA